MKPVTRIALLLLLLLPRLASAHGEEILSTIFLIVGSLLIFLIAALVVPVPYAEKAVLVIVYLVSISLAIYFTNGLPYLVNMCLINMTIGLAPVVTTVSACLIMRARRKKQTASKG